MKIFILWDRPVGKSNSTAKKQMKKVTEMNEKERRDCVWINDVFVMLVVICFSMLPSVHIDPISDWVPSMLKPNGKNSVLVKKNPEVTPSTHFLFSGYFPPIAYQVSDKFTIYSISLFFNTVSKFILQVVCHFGHIFKKDRHIFSEWKQKIQNA